MRDRPRKYCNSDWHELLMSMWMAVENKEEFQGAPQNCAQPGKPDGNARQPNARNSSTMIGLPLSKLLVHDRNQTLE